ASASMPAAKIERRIVPSPPARSDCRIPSVIKIAMAQQVQHLPSVRLPDASSKPRNVRERQLAAGNVHTAELGAAVQLRKDLARVEQALLVERAFQPLLLIEIGFREHHRHQVALLDAYAMFAGQHAPDLDA